MRGGAMYSCVQDPTCQILPRWAVIEDAAPPPCAREEAYCVY
jgi:hypothetical protein